jgi:hypothetical protein
VQENILQQVVHLIRRNSRQEDSVDYARVLAVKLAERGAIAVAGRIYELRIFGDFNHGRRIHRPTFPYRGGEVNLGFDG